MMTLREDPGPLLDLLDLACEGKLDEAGAEQIREWLKREHYARQLCVEYLDLNAVLFRMDSLEPAPDLISDLILQTAPQQKPTRRFQLWKSLLLGTSCLLIFSMMIIGGAQVYHVYLAPQAIYVEATSDIQFSKTTESQLVRSGLKRGQWLDVKSGFVTLRFRSGADVTLQGPARFQVVHSEKGYLEQGKLTALVPPIAEGFIVQTDSMELVDWGTEFLVETDPEKESTAIVRTGRCGVRPVVNGRPHGAYQEITAGNALTFQFSRTAYEGGKPPRDWIPAHRWESFSDFDQLSSGISDLEGQVRVAREVPGMGTPWLNPVDTSLYVVKEGDEVIFDHPITFVTTEGLLTVSSGSQVQSYLIHLPESPRDFYRIQAGIEFQGKILGVIANRQNLEYADQFFEDPRFDYPFSISRGLNLETNPEGIQIDDDRQQIRFDLVDFDGWFDQVRVLVEVQN